MRHVDSTRCQVMGFSIDVPQAIVELIQTSSHNNGYGHTSFLTEPIRMRSDASDGGTPCPDTPPLAARARADGTAYPFSVRVQCSGRPLPKRFETPAPGTTSPMGGEKNAFDYYQDPHSANSDFSSSGVWCSAFDTDCQHVKDKKYCAEHLPSEGRCPFIVEGIQ